MFQPARRPNDARFLAERDRVSIHAPRAGRDTFLNRPIPDPPVSIHAPRAGRDRWRR